MASIDRLPIEVLVLLFRRLVPPVIGRNQRQEFHRLLGVSRIFKAILEPLLYENILEDDLYDENESTESTRGSLRASSSSLRVLLIFRTFLHRPDLGHMVTGLYVEEVSESIDDEQDMKEDVDLVMKGGKEIECEKEEEREEEEEGGGGGWEHDKLPQGHVEAKSADSSRLTADDLAKATKFVNFLFETRGKLILFERESWIKRVEAQSMNAIAALIICQTPNLYSLSLGLRYGVIQQIAWLFNNPGLRELSVSWSLPELGFESDDPDGLSYVKILRGRYKRKVGNLMVPLVPPLEFFEMLLLKAQNLKSLKYEVLGDVSQPSSFDVWELRAIVEKHKATLEELRIALVLVNWSGGQHPHPPECTNLDGSSFGPLLDFPKLKILSIQLEVLLGDPSRGNCHHLVDVLPKQLEKFHCFSLPRCGSRDDAEPIWDQALCRGQLTMLDLAAYEYPDRFPLLYVCMELSRTVTFDSLDETESSRETPFCPISNIDFCVSVKPLCVFD